MKDTAANQTTEHVLNLIQGDFSPTEAQEILSHLIDKKINFHELRQFSQDIRFGIKDEASKKRIAQLKDAKEQLSKIIEEAHAGGRSLKIKSSIEIELI